MLNSVGASCAVAVEVCTDTVAYDATVIFIVGALLVVGLVLLGLFLRGRL